MKTITIKLPESEARELDIFVKKRHYPSKSEFIRSIIMEKLEISRKEKYGWLILAEKSLQKIWSNKKDDETWNKYL